jgi:Cft2 family RNA processing exonuclease
MPGTYCSASVEVWLKHGGVERKLVFSGDLGQYGTPILQDPARNTEADLVLMESTYGNRLHRDREATVREMESIIQDADHRRGNVLIPAFAVGRTQEILHLLATTRNGTTRWKVFLDNVAIHQICCTGMHDAGDAAPAEPRAPSRRIPSHQPAPRQRSSSPARARAAASCTT